MSGKRTMPYGRPVLVTVVMVAAAALAPQRLAGQGAPTVLYGCYVPNSGTVYRIKVDGLPTDCRSKNHVEFTWSLQGPAGPPGQVGPAGPQGIAGPSGGVSGRVTIKTSADALPGVTTLLAPCPAGKKLLGGGYRGDIGVTFPWYNGPAGVEGPSDIPSETVWRVSVLNSGTNPVTLRAFAICSDAP